MTGDIDGTPREKCKNEILPTESAKGLIRLQSDLHLEALFQKAFDCLSCRAAMVDQNGIILAVNQAWEDLFVKTGVQKKLTYEGVNYFDVCERLEGRQWTGGKSFAVGLQSVLDRQVDRFEMEYSLEDEGKLRCFSGRINGLDIHGLRYAFVLHQDISDYKEINLQSLSHRSQLPTLVETIKSLVSTFDLQDLLNIILKKLSNLIRYNAAAVFTFDDGNIIWQAYQGPPLSKNAPILLASKDSFSEVQQLISAEQSFFIQNIDDYPDLLGEISELIKLDQSNIKRFHSWLFLPMIINENQIGMMVLAYHEEAYYDHAALSIGELFANFAAIALQNAHLFELSQNSGILKERIRLAYELHDSIAQSLYSINLYANATQRALETKKFEIASCHLKELQKLSCAAVNDMRLMIFELNNQLLEEFGLARAIQARFEAIEAKQGIKTEIKLPEKLVFSKQMEYEIFGIIQEILIYIEKTTPIKTLSIAIDVEKDHGTIKIVSDQMIDPSKNNGDLDVARLNRIKNRVRKMGGSLQFNHSSNQETEIWLIWILDFFQVKS